MADKQRETAPAHTRRSGVPPVVFSSPGSVDDPEPMPARPPGRRQAPTRRRDS